VSTVLCYFDDTDTNTAEFSELNYTAFLSAFVKLRNATISVGMSVCPRRTTWLPLGGFSLHFIVGDF